MHSILVIFILIATTLSETNVTQKWEQFKLDYKKYYKNVQEEESRFMVFQSNLQTIDQHNKQYTEGKESYFMKATRFADLTQEEFRAWLRVPPANITRYPEIKPFDNLHNLTYPDTFDWRDTDGVVFEVPNEGSCKASWAFSVTGVIEGQNFLKNQQIVKLSAQELVDCSSLGEYNSGCDGGYTKNAFDYILNNGIITDADYPWRGKTDSICSDYNEENSFKIKEIKKVYNDDNGIAAQMAVAFLGPMSATIDASYMQFYAGGIFSSIKCLYATQFTHGVLIVGYGPGYWLLRNSWGPDWGENGYVRFTNAEHYDCGINENVLYPILE